MHRCGNFGLSTRTFALFARSPTEWIPAGFDLGTMATSVFVANGIGFRTPRAAQIEPLDGEYRLLPSQLDFDKGSARIAGSYGKGLSLQARLDKLDLSVANALFPNLGIDGSATGSVDYVQAAGADVPNIDTRLTITNFTRSSAVIVSEPVDIQVVGRLTERPAFKRATELDANP